MSEPSLPVDFLMCCAAWYSGAVSLGTDSGVRCTKGTWGFSAVVVVMVRARFGAVARRAGLFVSQLDIS